MSGIRIILRLAALVVLCAVVAAPVTAAQPQASDRQIRSTKPLTIDVQEHLNYAVFDIETAKRTRVVISYGTDRANLIPRPDQSLKRGRNIKLTPLAPNSRYFYSVIVTDASGKSTQRTGTFRTGPVRPATLSVVKGQFRLNGVPFFPIMAKMYTECPAKTVVDDSVAMGVNVLDHVGWPYCRDENNFARHITPPELHNLLLGKAWWLERNNLPLDGLPELMDLSGELFIEMTAGSLWACGPADSTASAWYKRLRISVARHNKQDEAVVYWGSVIGSGAVRTCMNAQRFSAQFWTAILAGANGVIYNHQHPHRLQDGVDIRPDVKVQAGKEAQHLATLYPVILAGDERRVSSSSDDVVIKAWRWSGGTYAVAINTENKSVSATIKWPGETGTARVLWQDRSKKLVTGGILERFRPHQVHIYHLP